jgi:hypothetical protein
MRTLLAAGFGSFGAMQACAVCLIEIFRDVIRETEPVEAGKRYNLRRGYDSILRNIADIC